MFLISWPGLINFCQRLIILTEKHFPRSVLQQIHHFLLRSTASCELVVIAYPYYSENQQENFFKCLVSKRRRRNSYFWLCTEASCFLVCPKSVLSSPLSNPSYSICLAGTSYLGLIIVSTRVMISLPILNKSWVFDQRDWLMSAIEQPLGWQEVREDYFVSSKAWVACYYNTVS